MIKGVCNRVVEWQLKTSKHYADPFNEIELYAFITGNDQEYKVPAFYMGDNRWGFRFASSTPGEYTAISFCSDHNDSSLHGVKTEIRIDPYTGDNPLYMHGRIKVSDDKKTFKHEDNRPFFWLGDTWWMALTKRLDYNSDFKTLTADRVEKGFSVV
ncbi:MAG: DUF5060 domain-containing protein, partial [Clostridia bacterium]|nr:DUF5060 domain-containing protein [Clostridia bacterium]